MDPTNNNSIDPTDMNFIDILNNLDNNNKNTEIDKKIKSILKKTELTSTEKSPKKNVSINEEMNQVNLIPPIN